MRKIDEIYYCGDCSKRHYIGNELWCALTDNKTTEDAGIPDWCPLANADEELQ